MTVLIWVVGVTLLVPWLFTIYHTVSESGVTEIRAIDMNEAQF